MISLKQTNEENGPLAPGRDRSAVAGIPQPKTAISLRVDRDVLDWFRADGKGYQTQMNAALRAHDHPSLAS